MGGNGAQGPQRRLAAVLFVDVVGFTALSSRDERASLALVERFENAVRDAAAAQGGTVVKFMGDGALAHFLSTESAVRAALALRAAFADGPSAVRVGVHLGDILVRADADVLGDGVNTASRIQSIAAPGEVVVSDEVWRQLRHTGSFTFTNRGSHQLKGLPERRTVWAVSGAEDAVPSRAYRRSWPGRRALAGAAAVVMLGLLLFAWFAGPPDIDVDAAAESTVTSLVVLPFDNLSGDPGEEYFVAGMHDALIGELTELGALRVISRTSAMRYRGSTAPLAQIARELDVQAVVAAAVLRSGDDVRIRAELIRVFPREESLWARTYDRQMRDVLALHSEVAKALADAIRLELTPREAARLARAEQVVPAAFDAYVRGREYWTIHTPQALDEAQRWYETALAHDPGFAPAYAGIAAVWYGRRQLGIVEPAMSTERVKAAAARALELDPHNARAHQALAIEAGWHDWDWAASERHFRRALELQPGDALTRAFYSIALRIMRRIDAGAEHGALALRSDPYNPIVHTISAGHLMEVGDADGAVTRLEAALQLWPGHVVLMRDYATVLEYAGRRDDALAVTRAIYVALGDEELVAAIDRADGFTAAMRGISAELERRAETGFVPPARIARYRLWAGDTDAALDWMERSIAIRDHGAAFFGLRTFLERLGGEPRYEAVLASIGVR